MKIATILIMTVWCIAGVGCRREDPGPPQQPTMTERTQTQEVIFAAGVDPVVQKTCPVMNEPIDPAIYTVYQGKKVFFSSRECIEAFENDPNGYLAKLPQFQPLHSSAQ